MSALTLKAAAPPLRGDEDGVLRVGDSRVTLETVLHAYEAGHPPEEIVRKFPSLRIEDVYETIGYCLRHRAEVEAYLAAGGRQAEEIRRRVEARCPPEKMAERIRAGRRNDR